MLPRRRCDIADDVVPGFTVTAEVDHLNAGKFDDADFSNWTGADKKSSMAVSSASSVHSMGWFYTGEIQPGRLNARAVFVL